MTRGDIGRFAVIAAVVAALAVAAVAIRISGRRGAPAVKRYEKTTQAMGTLVIASACAVDDAAAGGGIDAAFAEVRRLEGVLSHFNPASDISRINAAAPGTPVRVSPETISCLQHAIDISERTGGAFDVTVGPLVLLWKNAGKAGVLPTDDEVAAALAMVSYKALVVDAAAGTVTLRRMGVYVDLSSVAKGFIVERAAEKMRERGIDGGFVNGGGDLQFIGSDCDGGPWRVGIADPRASAPGPDILGGGAVEESLYVRRSGVVTSGNYEQFATIAGRRYSHIIDARTGRPAYTGPASVTVIAPDAATAAGWSTALSILGRDGEAAAREAGVEYLMYFVEGGLITRVESPGIARYRQPGAGAKAGRKSR